MSELVSETAAEETRKKRETFASVVEFLIWSFLLVVTLSNLWQEVPLPRSAEALFFAATRDRLTLLLTFVSTLSLFSWILTSNTVLVNIAAAYYRVPRHMMQRAQERRAMRQALLARAEELDERTLGALIKVADSLKQKADGPPYSEAIRKEAKILLTEALRSYIQNERARIALDVSREGQFDIVTTEFQQYMYRSRTAASTAQRRPNALLFAGTVIALLGLVFFIATLPGSIFGSIGTGPERISLPDVAATQVPQVHDVWASTLQLLPRLFMLIFIQVLAGFFLRQYRVSMEDFRYYESILRHREAQYLSYVLRRLMEDKKSMTSYAKEIMQDRALGTLARGQTTTTLEAQRTERNEFASVLEVVADFASAAKNRVTGQSHGHEPSKRKRKSEEHEVED